MADIVFVGVSTGSSLVHAALAQWQPLLGRECGMRGVDIPLGSADRVYVDLLADMERDPSILGAVVTSHKVRLYEAGASRFRRLDPVALACREVNAIRRRGDGSLEGWARDPISVGQVVDQIWPRADGTVVCLGAGGTAVALAHHLATARPRVELVCADRRPDALEGLLAVARCRVLTHLGDGPWDSLVERAPSGSLIVNATGLGKDRPGSPVTDAVRLPPSSVVWELNYRGDLQLLELARRQARGSQLDVHDGWELFCHGWAAALSVVLGVPDDVGLGRRFFHAVRDLRPMRT